MQGALQIARLFGIPVKIHWTFGLIFLWLGLTAYSKQGAMNWENLLWSVFAVFTLFICVILHELGHGLMARRYGVKTINIMLLPIGGLAILERLPERPKHELWVALAGPAVNFGLALLFSPFLLLSDPEKLWRQWIFLRRPGGNVFTYDIAAWEWFAFSLVTLNFAVAVFNLIPAYPMDGGRALRALLSLRNSRIKATLWATRAGQFFGGLFLLLGLYFGNWALVIIGFFIYIGAGTERRLAGHLDFLSRHRVADILRTSYSRIYLDDPPAKVTEQARQTPERHFLVFDQWQTLQGTIDSYRIGPHQGSGQPANLDIYLEREYFSLLKDDPLSLALEKFQSGASRILPVYDRDRLVGVLDESAVQTLLKSRNKT